MTRFGKYELLDRIGIGGMAEVFKAKIYGAEGFERLIAIKRILPNLVEDEDFEKMFIDEAKIAVRLNHPNIVGIDDLGKADGTLFIAMEYVHGRDLRAIYDVEEERRGHTPVGIACHIIMKMCEALHHAHSATGPRGEPLNVIHRDVSPQNVLLSFDGEVKVTDFGLAKARGRMVQTQAGVVKGKLAYMSPEQLRGDEIDHRVDVFGLGIVLFELLTGVRLFLGPSDMDTLRRVYEANIPSMQDLDAEIHEDLQEIVNRALKKEPDERYPSALALFEDLQKFVYAHGEYAGTSTLRRYVREAFPDAAPPAPTMPPFAPSPATEPPPVVTRRPPRMGTATASGSSLQTVPARSTQSSNEAPSRPPTEDDFEIEVDVEVSATIDPPSELDTLVAASIGPATDVPPPNHGLEASRVHPSERDLPLESEQDLPLDSYLYEDAEASEPFDAGPDTNPAPAPLRDAHPPLADAVWDDTTEFEPPSPQPASRLGDRADVPEDLSEEATQVVDPHSLEGSGG